MKKPGLILDGAVWWIAVLQAAVADGAYFELRLYDVTTRKLDGVLERFRDTVEPVRRRRGIETLGYWTTDQRTNGDKFIYLIAAASQEELRKREKEFAADPDFQAGYAASNRKHGKTVEEIVSYPLHQSGWSPKFELKQSDPPRAFELRIYDVLPGKMQTYLENYRDVRTKLFEKHGFNSLGFWTTIGTNQPDKFVLLLAHRDVEGIHRSKLAYHADPEWKQRVDEALKPQGQLPTNVVSMILTPTSFSPSR